MQVHATKHDAGTFEWGIGLRSNYADLASPHYHASYGCISMKNSPIFPSGLSPILIAKCGEAEAESYPAGDPKQGC